MEYDRQSPTGSIFQQGLCPPMEAVLNTITMRRHIHLDIIYRLHVLGS